MSTLLVLGSKPEPALPPEGSYDALACANASARSAIAHGLRAPSFTVMSAILTSGHKAANDLALEALRGLHTGDLYVYPRPIRGRTALGRAWNRLRTYKMQPAYIRRRLRSLDYGYDRFISWPLEEYLNLIEGLCDRDGAIADVIERKNPSTGLVAIALGLAVARFERIIVAGFSFEISHAYARNPLIDEQGSSVSKHADTDVAVLGYLSRKYRSIYTTETVVHERSGVPLLPEDTQPSTAAPRCAPG
ncbi:MAG: hypothetical protein QNJ30_01960 [Kiloniellales bacterium]|nr:hypothetical protein [Kiloniellales bacterium]